jgi:hypothetical protein
MPERAIKHLEDKLVPDGLIEFESGEKIAVEIENSFKAKRRFERFLWRWDGVDGLLCVLYVATTPKLREWIRQAIVRGPKDSPLGVVLWEDLKSGAPPIWTVAGELNLLARRAF